MELGRPLRISWPKHLSVAVLHRLYRREPLPAVRVKLQALWLLRKGLSLGKTAESVGFSERSVRSWIRRMEAGGLRTLRARRALSGKVFSERLSSKQWEELREHLRKGTTRTVDQVRQWVEKRWGILYSREGLRLALHRHQLRLKVPRPRHEKTDRAVQEAWKKGGLRSSCRRR